MPKSSELPPYYLPLFNWDTANREAHINQRLWQIFNLLLHKNPSRIKIRDLTLERNQLSAEREKIEYLSNKLLQKEARERAPLILLTKKDHRKNKSKKR